MISNTFRHPTPSDTKHLRLPEAAAGAMDTWVARSRSGSSSFTASALNKPSSSSSSSSSCRLPLLSHLSLLSIHLLCRPQHPPPPPLLLILPPLGLRKFAPSAYVTTARVHQHLTHTVIQCVVFTDLQSLVDCQKKSSSSSYFSFEYPPSTHM